MMVDLNVYESKIKHAVVQGQWLEAHHMMIWYTGMDKVSSGFCERLLGFLARHQAPKCDHRSSVLYYAKRYVEVCELHARAMAQYEGKKDVK